MPTRSQARGTSIVEIGIAIILLGITALAMASSSSLMRASNETAGETALARRLIQRQITRFNRLARLVRERRGVEEWDTLAGRTTTNTPLPPETPPNPPIPAIDIITAATAFPNIWVPANPRFTLNYVPGGSPTALGNMTYFGFTQQNSNLNPAPNGIGVLLVGDTSAIDDTGNAWHVYRDLSDAEWAFLLARDISVQVTLAPLVSRSAPDPANAGQYIPPSYKSNVNIDWVYQISVFRGTQLLMRSVGVGP